MTNTIKKKILISKTWDTNKKRELALPGIKSLLQTSPSQSADKPTTDQANYKQWPAILNYKFEIMSFASQDKK